MSRQLRPGDHLLSSYGYVTRGFRRVRRAGGHTFLDGGNAHPRQFWRILEEEHRRWDCREPPIARHHYRRALERWRKRDFVLSPSSHVTRSFLAEGFRPEQLLRNVYPLDLACFTPATTPRPARPALHAHLHRQPFAAQGDALPAGGLSPGASGGAEARLLLTSAIADNARPVLTKYRDLPIEWSPGLAHPALAERLRSADLFLLPSLEEGLARTITEALACGLPAVVTPNTGADDFITRRCRGALCRSAMRRRWRRRRSAGGSGCAARGATGAADRSGGLFVPGLCGALWRAAAGPRAAAGRLISRKGRPALRR